MSGFDKWLSRITLISQILLVVIALVTVKLTVIPLYQKELSSEELAKAQIQLSNVQAKIETLTSSVGDKEKELAITVSRLKEIEQAERAGRDSLSALNNELKNQAKNLAELQHKNKKITDESARLKIALVSENQLKFRQALEWFTLVTDLTRDCYRPDIAEFFANSEERETETAKGCSPHSHVKSGIKTLRELRRDSSGDPLYFPEGTLDKWLNLAEVGVDREEFNMQSVYEPSVFKSLNSDNLVKKDTESSVEFRARVDALDEARNEYARKARARDHDVAKRFIRNLNLSM